MNPNTIIRAYKELEVEGIVVSKRGQGNFVTEQGSKLTEEVKYQMISKTIDKLLTEAYHLQLSHDTLLELVKQRIDKLAEGKKNKGE